MKPPLFKNRWLIKGTLTTKTELHIGDGESREIAIYSEPDPEGQGKKAVEVSTVCTDCADRAYIPGSAIKGVLRELVMSKAEKPNIRADYEDLFGSDLPDLKTSVGGKLEFWDARHCSGNGTEADSYIAKADNLDELKNDRNRPWWDNNRKTCVSVSVSLDRRTRAAKENFLYHLEYVPAGESFAFEIGGENLGDNDIARLLALLHRFNDGSVRLGAETSNGWGRVVSKVTEIRCFEGGEQKLSEWKKTKPCGLSACERKSEVEKEQIEGLKTAFAISEPGDMLTIQLHLTLESPWLIRDPRQRERSLKAKELAKLKKSEEEKKLAESQKPADGVPIQDEDGKPFVPAKSLRGALRARAEMILRTLGIQCKDHPSKMPDISPELIRQMKSLERARADDLAAQLFGLSDWQAPLHIPRLELPKDAIHKDNVHQEFVAIDRFTGGAAETAKFNAELAASTPLTGTLTLDVGRLKLVDSQLASLGLLALVLRDLAEGDIPIGSGSSKGQGFCTADATITESGVVYHDLVEWFQKSTLLTESLQALRNQQHANETSTSTIQP